VVVSAVTAMPDERVAVLRSFDRALGRETHVLMQRPELVWQQLYNRLQWAEEPLPGLLEPELQRRSAPGTAPWLRTKTRLRESEALRLTLAGHTGSVYACAISPDCSFVVSASADDTCKIWDAATGEERASLSGHGYGVISCAIWDAATGKERATLTGHTGGVTACAISPDCSFVVSVSWDNTCKIWDATTGKERASLPLSGRSECVALHPRRQFAACGDAGGGVYLIDLVGIEYGPIVVTAVDRGEGPVVRCPSCRREHPLDESLLGTVFDCPTATCDLRLRVNPFVLRPAAAAPGSAR
jgi:hypothetical protein